MKAIGQHSIIVYLLRRAFLYPIELVFFRGRSGIDNADEGLRYLPISDDILNGQIDNPSILEIGSGSKGITPYVPFQITGVDISFSGSVAKRLKPVSHTAENLPFPDSSYNYVVCADMLEHVPSSQRPKVLSELLRVANNRVYLAVPCGRYAEAHDKTLDALYLRLRGERLAFLKEHVDNGLPHIDDLVTSIKTAAAQLERPISISVKPNVNLSIRYCFMRLLITPKIDIFFPMISPFFCILRQLLNFGECYRQIITIGINPSMPPKMPASAEDALNTGSRRL
jgi:hypothetical protein